MSAPAGDTRPNPTTSEPTAPRSGLRGRAIAVTSGKGGVGKTFLTANLAAMLARQGERVLVLDADLGLANLDVVLNLAPTVTLHDVFTGKLTWQQALLAAPGGFQVLLAGSGMVEYSRLTPEVQHQLHKVMSEVRERFDVVLLDTGAGISDVVLYTLSLADEVIVVATPEPTSMTDAYATIKVIANGLSPDTLGLVVNQVNRPGDGRTVHHQLQAVLDRYVNAGRPTAIQLQLLGEVPQDQEVRTAVLRRELLAERAPGAAASAAVAQVATRLLRTALR